MCRRKEMRMTECNRFFLVESGNRSYLLEVEPMTTLDLAWFTPGSVVTITDDNRESKIFVKE